MECWMIQQAIPPYLLSHMSLHNLWAWISSCTCVCGEERASDWVLARVTPSRGEVPSSSYTPPLVDEKATISKHVSVGRNKNMIMGPDGTSNQDYAGEDRQKIYLTWRGWHNLLKVTSLLWILWRLNESGDYHDDDDDDDGWKFIEKLAARQIRW
jgi:hypothetical protein